jgi:hypothetical protein
MRDYIKNFDKQDLIDLVVSITIIGFAFLALYIAQGL